MSGGIGSPSRTNKFYSQAKVVKLRIHPRSFSAEDLIVNLDALAREKFQLFDGTVVEILPTGEKENVPQSTHLLLEVKHLLLDMQPKGAPISISSEVAQAFKLTGLREVCVRRVDKQSVGLDLMELRFKDQSLGRSDLWRFTNSLIGKGIFKDRRLEFAGMRMTVSNLWSRGESVRSGAVVDTTRVAFRSASARFFLFLQISSEMWEFDPSGDMYFNKAVDGFLTELFSKWLERNCNHEVTVVLFARKFFTGHCAPTSSNSVLQSDKEGRFYHDFYKVVIDGETRKDWSSAITEIKRGFLEFQEIVAPSNALTHTDESDVVEKWCISPAPCGNILEAVNLSLNMFEQHYIDCSFRSTGHQVVIISPGVGVFEVDQELSRLTQEKTIDQGVGLDLVCLNEQPLHAVPLFKFIGSESPQQEQYEIAHWINYSFYSPPRPWTSFLPRINIPDYRINVHLKAPRFSKSPQSLAFFNKKFLNKLLQRERDGTEPVIDYDQYDADIFSLSDPRRQSGQIGVAQRRLHSFDNARELPGSLDENILKAQANSSDDVWKDVKDEPVNKTSIKIRKRNSASLSASLGAGGHKPHSEELQPQFLCEQELFSPPTTTATLKSVSAAAMYDRRHSNEGASKFGKAPLNPFNPNRVAVEMNSHRCRWMHTFPLDKVGRAFQTHHLHSSGLEKLDENQTLETGQGMQSKSFSSTPVSQRDGKEMEKSKLNNGALSVEDVTTESVPHRSKVVENFGLVRRKGMDWTSLTEPACLPITTDYFPDEATLNKNYSDTPAQLVASNISAGMATWKAATSWRADHQNMNTYQIFREMISQRLSQGFQLVFDSGNMFSLLRTLAEMEDQLTGRRTRKKKPKGAKVITKFSLGRVFHKIELDNLNLFTNIYKEINPLGLKELSYSYWLVADGGQCVPPTQQATCTFTHTKTESYNWNYLDQHVCGFSEFEELHESHRYWRCRFLLLPSTPPQTPSLPDEWYRWRDRFTNAFIRLLEFLNHIKRTTPHQIPHRSEHRNLSLQGPMGSWPYLSPSPSPSPASTPRRSLSTEEGSEDRQYSLPTSPTRSLTDGAYTKKRFSKGSRRSSRSREDLTTVDEEASSEATERRSKTPTFYNSAQGLRAKKAFGRRTSQDVGQEMQFTSQQHQQTWRRLKLDSTSNYSDDQDTRRHGSGGEAEGAVATTLNIVPPSPSTPIPLTPTPDCDLQHPLKPLEEKEFDSLTVHSSPKRILAALLDKWEGIDVLGPQSSLRAGCFIGLEAVRHLTLKMVDNPGRRAVVRVLQRMINSGHIIHASGNRDVGFIDGYYLYRIVEDSAADSLSTQSKEFLDMDWEMYRKSWFEVAIHHPVLEREEEGQSLSMPQSSSLNEGYSSFNDGTLPYYMHYEDKDGSSVLSEVFSRYVELNPDLQGISNRPEWFYVLYSPDYHPMKAYALEFQWMAATISILHKLIQSWSHKAAMCEFNLVPVPLIGYPIVGGCERPHPFRCPLFVHLKIPVGYHQFLNTPAGDKSLSKLILSILNRFGFLEDPHPSSDFSSEQPLLRSSSLSFGVYVHYTGCAMVQPVTIPLSCQEDGPGRKISGQSPNGILPHHETLLALGEDDDNLGNGCYDNPVYGFHWFWNHCYLQQITSQAAPAEKHKQLLDEFKSCCTSDSLILPFACSQLLEQTETPPTATPHSQ